MTKYMFFTVDRGNPNQLEPEMHIQASNADEAIQRFIRSQQEYPEKGLTCVAVPVSNVTLGGTNTDTEEYLTESKIISPMSNLDSDKMRRI